MYHSRIHAPDNLQFDLFGESLPSEEAKRLITAADSGRRFIEGDPEVIFIGLTPLREYLRKTGITAPFLIADLLKQQNWSDFEARYSATGRAPYTPRAMLGLIVYGIMQGVTSLRALERLARLDLGCMWLTGGITPDHANIGRFIQLHEASLTERFFVDLTRSIIQRTGSSNERLAGDGTVIEAACSNYKLLKADAVEQRLHEAEQQLQQDPDNKEKQARFALATECQFEMEQRQAARKSRGRQTDSLRISPTEPQAVIHKQKRGRGFAPAYIPSVVANVHRIILGHALDSTNEHQMVPELLALSLQIDAEAGSELLLDTGYFQDNVIALSLERDISLLCPPKLPSKGDSEKAALFHKAEFQYDPETDAYTCPAGQLLNCISHTRHTAVTREHKVYACTACNDCPLRSTCTRNRRGRQIKRYPEDEAREALKIVMQQPNAKKVSSKRKAMVEPVFGVLRERQGLKRFRRRGLAGVRVEFALHVLAYNLSRAVALLLSLFLSVVIALTRSREARNKMFILVRVAAD